MPKELIRDMFNGQRQQVLTTTDDGQGNGVMTPGYTEPEYWAMRIGWDRDGAVALVPTELTETGLPVDEVNTVRHIWLDRRGVNDMIRVLRKARDQAFGADA